jgi:hypothetical protein
MPYSIKCLGDVKEGCRAVLFRLTLTTLKLKLIYDRRSVGQSVLMLGSHLEPMTRFLFCLTIVS